MAEQNGMHPESDKPDSTDSDATFEPASDVPMEEEDATEPDHPRRAASAEFIVQGEVGSASVLREAMDPANQSLGEALRLSYRVLQLVILGLIVLFLISGFRRIETAETGVKTMFGKIQGEGLEAELDPGLAISWLPYPAAEFIVFNQSHATSLSTQFWPNAQMRRHDTVEAASTVVQPHDEFRPGIGSDFDGMVLLQDGIGHVQLQARFRIRSAVAFVNNVQNEAQAKRIVDLALQRATIQELAAMRLDEMIDQAEVVADRVQTGAQAMLDEMGAGIEIQRVQAINLRPPLAIIASMNQLGQAESTAEVARSEARAERSRLLVTAAGEAYGPLLELIDDYEHAILNEGPDSPESRSLLAQIDLMLESEAISGEVARSISMARAYSDAIVGTLTGFKDRFESLYPAYRANPEFVVRTQWIETYSRIIDGDMVEIMYLPRHLASTNVTISSSNELMVKRRRASQEQRKDESVRRTGLGAFRHALGDHNIRRRLEIDEQGTVVGRRASDLRRQ